MKCCHFGVCEWLFPLSGPSAMRVLAQIGFDGVQILDAGGVEQNDPLMLPWVQDAYRQAMDVCGISIQTLQLQSLVRSGALKCPPASQRGKDALRAIQKGAQVCQKLNIPNLMVESFFASSITCREDFENTAAVLRQAGAITKDYGIQLIYESFMPRERTMRLHELCGGAFRLCYDTLNPLRYGFGDPLEELREYDLALIDHIHVKDAPAGYQGSVCLGTGAGLFGATASILTQRGFSGWVVSENYYCMDPMGKEDPAVTAARDLHTLKTAFPSAI